MNDLDFNLGEVEETTTYPDKVVLPKGSYDAIVNKVGWHDNKKGTGQYLRVDFLITEENQPEGVFIPAFLNLKNPSTEAVNIARQELKKLVKAIGKDPESFKDSSELLNARVILNLDVDDKYNRIKGYKSASETSGDLPDLKSKPKAETSTFDDDDIPF